MDVFADSAMKNVAECDVKKEILAGMGDCSKTDETHNYSVQHDGSGNDTSDARQQPLGDTPKEEENETEIEEEEEDEEEEDLGEYFRKLVLEYRGKRMMKKALLNEFNGCGLRDRLKMITELQALIDDQASDHRDQMRKANHQYDGSLRKQQQQQQHQQRRQRIQYNRIQHKRRGESKESVRGEYTSIDNNHCGSDSSDAEAATSDKQHHHHHNQRRHTQQSSNIQKDGYPVGTSTLGLLDVDSESLDANAVDEAWVKLLNDTLSSDKRQVLMEQYQREMSSRSRYHMLLEFTSYLRQPQQKQGAMDQNGATTTDGANEAGMGMRRRHHGIDRGNGHERGPVLPTQTQSHAKKESMDLREIFGDLSSMKGGKHNSKVHAASRADRGDEGGASGGSNRRRSSSSNWCCEGFGIPLPGIAIVAVIGLVVFRVVSHEVDVTELFAN